ncbi:MAG: PhoX family protein [Actinomycetota bacterium]
MARVQDRMDRRSFLRHSAAAGGALLGSPLMGGLAARGAESRSRHRKAKKGEGGYGELFPTPDQNGNELLALPEGFRYTTIGVTGAVMSDGNHTPKAHDGMAAFRMSNGNIRLVRNHEVRDEAGLEPPIGNTSSAYDPIGPGGTTSLELDVDRSGRAHLVRDFVSLNGTIVNCAGGPTPWGTWLTCEETTEGQSHGWARPHGYIFEVPASVERQVTAVPLPAMGRFVHEAVAVDPDSGFVYETEDETPCGFYRFVPDVESRLDADGRLQMLAIKEKPNYQTGTGQRLHKPLPVTWVDIDDPDPAAAESNPRAVYEQGAAKGGAAFLRLEGCWYGEGSIFINSTSGGDAGLGQVWEYRPRGRSGGQLSLLFESSSPDVLESPDNICVTPRGGIVLCEDGDAEQYLRGLTMEGEIFDFALNLASEYEWAGATFSPKGNTLFVNIQGATSGPVTPGDEGMTFAIWGPWEDGAL